LSKLQASIWEKTSVKQEESFTLNDIDMDDDLLKNLIEKDTNTGSNTYKLK
jgi:hypothetical protein